MTVTMDHIGGRKVIQRIKIVCLTSNRIFPELETLQIMYTSIANRYKGERNVASAHHALPQFSFERILQALNFLKRGAMVV